MRNLLGRVASWLGRRAQPAPVDADIARQHELNVALDRLVEKSFAAGVSVERARIAEILNAPGAATFLEIAVDLALGDATGAQAAAVLGRAEADAATRAGAIKSNILDRTSSHVTLH
jgi:hypothetical protein